MTARILLVDDERHIIDLLRLVLEREGFRDVAEATTAADALVLAAEAPTRAHRARRDAARRRRIRARGQAPRAHRGADPVPDRRGRSTSTSSPASPWAATTTSRSRSTRSRWWRASRRTCAARGATAEDGRSGAGARRAGGSGCCEDEGRLEVAGARRAVPGARVPAAGVLLPQPRTRVQQAAALPAGVGRGADGRGGRQHRAGARPPAARAHRGGPVRSRGCCRRCAASATGSSCRPRETR